MKEAADLDREKYVVTAFVKDTMYSGARVHLENA